MILTLIIWTVIVVGVAFILSCGMYGTREMIDWLKRLWQ